MTTMTIHDFKYLYPNVNIKITDGNKSLIISYCQTTLEISKTGFYITGEFPRIKISFEMYTRINQLLKHYGFII